MAHQQGFCMLRRQCRHGVMHPHLATLGLQMCCGCQDVLPAAPVPQQHMQHALLAGRAPKHAEGLACSSNDKECACLLSALPSLAQRHREKASSSTSLCEPMPSMSGLGLTAGLLQHLKTLGTEEQRAAVAGEAVLLRRRADLGPKQAGIACLAQPRLKEVICGACIICCCDRPQEGRLPPPRGLATCGWLCWGAGQAPHCICSLPEGR